MNVGALSFPSRKRYWRTRVIARRPKRRLRSQRGHSSDEASNDRGGKAPRYNQDVEKIERSLKKRLNKYGLEMNQEKTEMVKFNQRAYPKIKQGQFDYLGFTFYIKLTCKGRCHIAVKTAKKRFRAKLRNVKTWCQRNRHRYKLKTLWLLFNAKLRGHMQYYAVSLNTAEVSNFVVKAPRIFFKWINRRSQKKSITWEKFELFCKAFPRVKVRVQHRLY